MPRPGSDAPLASLMLKFAECVGGGSVYERGREKRSLCCLRMRAVERALEDPAPLRSLWSLLGRARPDGGFHADIRRWLFHRRGVRRLSEGPGGVSPPVRRSTP